jgi:hypothetical protein
LGLFISATRQAWGTTPLSEYSIRSGSIIDRPLLVCNLFIWFAFLRSGQLLELASLVQVSNILRVFGVWNEVVYHLLTCHFRC